MRITVEKLRTWIVVLGVLLVLSLVAIFAYARFRMRQISRDLPQKLGLEIQQSTNNFTISKSSKGRTLFVLHASKAVQYKGGGRAVLHDVSIELYGTDGSRADRITGSEFDFDPATKIVRADGMVDILVSDPRAHSPGSGATPSSEKAVHVKTRGLVFNQETQVATTTQALTFTQDASSGSASGATYDGVRGTLALTADVVLNTVVADDPVSIRARSATFDRASRQMFLIEQVIDYQQRHGSSDQATIFFSPEGKANQIRATGHVHLRADDGSDLQASASTVQMDNAGMLQQIQMDGGLLFVDRGPVHSVHVNSNSGVFSFVPGAGQPATSHLSATGRLNHLRLTGAVSAVDQQTGLGADTHSSETRETRASQIDVDFHPSSAGSIQPMRVLASGNAEVTIHTIRPDAPQQITKLHGSQIFSTLVDGHRIADLRATGDAGLEQSTPGGLTQTSHGDSLDVKFEKNSSTRHVAGKITPHSGTAKPADVVSGSSQIETASLSGHAVLVQQPNASSGQEKTTATADRMTYQGSTGLMILTGGEPRITTGDSEISAASIQFNHDTGDATASGNLKASYRSPSPSSGTAPDRRASKTADSSAASEATHVVADHAVLNHAKNETTFFGGARGDARVWQGGNSVTAPRIILNRSQQALAADGGVKANFVETTGTQQPGDAQKTARVVQTSSKMLTYSGGERKVTLSGGVVARNADGTVSAGSVELFLEPEAVGPLGASGTHALKNAAGPSGQVSRMIAEQNVRLTQGSRTGSGEKLVYTAEDGHFVLTGTSASMPRITDPEHGTVTGSSLIFDDRDDSVVVGRGLAPTATDSRTKSEPHGKGMATGNHPAGTVQ